MTAQTSATTQTETEDGYADFAKLIFERAQGAADGPVFTTDVDPDKLWGHFLWSLPEERRQHYNCNCCRSFIQTYGGLADLNLDKEVTSLFFDVRGSVPPFFAAAVSALHDLVINGKITGVFQWDEGTWGTPANVSQKTQKRWSHLHAKVTLGRPHNKVTGVETAGQRMARFKEDHGVLCRAFSEYTTPVVEEAVRVLKADVLTRPEKALAIAEWYRDVLAQRSNPNAVWLAVATAPAGFTHVKNTVVSTLFDDVKAGMSFEAASKRWAEKMHPLQYQRPTREVGEGAIVAAQKLVEKLGVERSFERRYAKMSDIREFVWRRPEPEAPKAGGLFEQLKKRQEAEVKRMRLPAKDVSFLDLMSALVGAKDVQVELPAYGNYSGFLTAVHEDAPNLLQWGNPVSSYVYNGGSAATSWGLAAGWQKPDAMFLAPHMWGGENHPNHSKFVCFAFKGAVDGQMIREKNLCLFPEILKSEFHGIRAVIEANNRTKTPSGGTEAEVNGLCYGASKTALNPSAGVLQVRIDGEDFRLVRWS